MTPLAYLKLTFALLLVGAGGYLAFSYHRMSGQLATAEARIEAAERKAEENSRALDTLSGEVVRRAEMDKAIRDARQTITINLDEVQREDPVARDYLGESVPDSVREAYLRSEVR